MKRTAVWLCSCGGNITEKVDFGQVGEALRLHPGVARVDTVEFLCSEEGKAEVTKQLAEDSPDRVVFAACSPRDHGGTCRGIMQSAGLNPYLQEMANIRELVAWVTEDPATATAKALTTVVAAVERVAEHTALEPRRVDVATDIVVIGAGPAGMKAALTAAEAGRHVYLVERTAAIGGLPVTYDQVFPTMECGPCLLETLLDAVLHGPASDHIEVLTQTEVREVTGSYGRFKVTAEQRPRFVDVDRCVGCTLCVEPCPVTGPERMGLVPRTRKAIDFAFDGALPYVPNIDPEACLRMTQGDSCRLCEEICPVDGAVVFADRTVEHQWTVGAVVAATGADVFESGLLPALGHGSNPDVITAIELERILASAGPDGGLTTAEGRPPESVAIVHCVGSLDAEHAPYCSGICCQIAFKLAHLLRRRLPELQVVQLFKSLVSPGKEGFALYEEARTDPSTHWFRYADIRELHVGRIGSRTSVVHQGPGGTQQHTVDMVVLCPAIVPKADSPDLARVLDIDVDRHGFFAELHGRLEASQASTRGIGLAGSCTSPVDIRGATTQGVAAVGHILAGLVPGRQLEIEPTVAEIHAAACSGCRVCVPLCPYKAISFHEDTVVAEVDPIACVGCGTCVAACPAGAITGHGFTDRQITAEIQAVLR